jgi:hypothetical protein
MRPTVSVKSARADIHHFAPGSSDNARMADAVPEPAADDFIDGLRTLTGDDLLRVAAALDSDAICDEVDWWRATIAIDKVLRHQHCTRRAARVATDAAHAVQAAAGRAGIPLPDAQVTRVARAAAEVARGLSAGASARPVVGMLLEYWGETSPV